MTPTGVDCLALEYCANSIRNRPLQCDEAAMILNHAGAVATAITAPPRCASTSTLIALPLLMKSSGCRRERCRLFRGYLRAASADVRLQIASRESNITGRGDWSEYLKFRVLAVRLYWNFVLLGMLGRLFRCHVPVRFALLATSTERLLSRLSPSKEDVGTDMDVLPSSDSTAQ